MFSYIISITALIISLLALIVSIFTLINSIKQTRIMQEQLNEQQKHKYTDDPINAYTVKLDGIKNSIYNVSESIKNLNREK